MKALGRDVLQQIVQHDVQLMRFALLEDTVLEVMETACLEQETAETV